MAVIIKKLLLTIAIGFAIGFAYLWGVDVLFGFAKELHQSVNKALFGWSDANVWVKIYLIIGYFISVYGVVRFVKEHIIDKPNEKKTLESLIIYVILSFIFLPVVIMFGTLLWPVVLWRLIKCGN